LQDHAKKKRGDGVGWEETRETRTQRGRKNQRLHKKPLSQGDEQKKNAPPGTGRQKPKKLQKKVRAWAEMYGREITPLGHKLERGKNHPLGGKRRDRQCEPPHRNMRGKPGKKKEKREGAKKKRGRTVGRWSKECEGVKKS